MNTWILVVARDGAKLYEQSGRRAPLKKINEYSNPDGRKQDRELRSDKPGRSMRSGSPSRHALSPHK